MIGASTEGFGEFVDDDGRVDALVCGDGDGVAEVVVEISELRARGAGIHHVRRTMTWTTFKWSVEAV
jgi:hypothetical protein